MPDQEDPNTLLRGAVPTIWNFEHIFQIPLVFYHLLNLIAFLISIFTVTYQDCEYILWISIMEIIFSGIIIGIFMLTIYEYFNDSLQQRLKGAELSRICLICLGFLNFLGIMVLFMESTCAKTIKAYLLIQLLLGVIFASISALILLLTAIMLYIKQRDVNNTINLPSIPYELSRDTIETSSKISY